MAVAASRRRALATLAVVALLAAACSGGLDETTRRRIERTDQVAVPALSGRPLKQAKNLLRAQNLKFEVTRQIFPRQRPGRVVGQEPPQGTLVEEGTTVVVEVARGR